tara:strand:+ start:243 stop:581 length:339 start_codon:yes stop_codon:yes gene_type:complete
MIPDDIKEKIDNGTYSFLDKVLSGGLGYGKFCIPDELPHIILAIVFPPFSILWNYHLGYYSSLWECIRKFFTCFILTTFLFYFPGLIYAVNEISCKAKIRVTKDEYYKAAAS